MTSPGRCWVLTSVSNGTFLTYDLFTKNGFDVDECHYTSDAAAVYTYVHFKKPIHQTTLDNFLQSLRKTCNFVLFEIFGYESICKSGPDQKLEEHVGFKVLLNHYLAQNPAFTSCTDGKPEISRGIFWKNDAVPRIKEILKVRSQTLASHFDGMQQELRAYKEKASLVETLQQELLNAEAKIGRYEHYKFVYFVLEYRISHLDREAQKQLLEPDHLGRPIFPGSVFLRSFYDEASA